MFFSTVSTSIAGICVIICVIISTIIGAIIGAVVSYPVMNFIWCKEGLSWMFYVPSFICGTLIGGSIAYVFLRKFADNGMLAQIQNMLATRSYQDKSSLLSNTLVIAAFGAILFVVIEIASGIFKLTSPIFDVLPYVSLVICIVVATVYYVFKKVKKDGR